MSISLSIHRGTLVWLMPVFIGLSSTVMASQQRDNEILTLALPGEVVLRLVRIPAGEFIMGSPPNEPDRYRDEVQRRVSISRDFFLGETELTQAQWLAVMGTHPGSECSPCALAGRQPATCMNWAEVAGENGFLEKATSYLRETEQLGAESLRLPSEAEWEYAARAGARSRFSFGEATGCSDDCGPCPAAEPFMLWCGNESGCAVPVGSFTPNSFGLYDMHGNVWEWVADRFGRRASGPAIDPRGPENGSHFVIRGCSWTNSLSACRSAARNADAKTHRGDVLGFRAALTVSTEIP